MKDAIKGKFRAPHVPSIPLNLRHGLCLRRCLAERVKSESGRILWCEEQAATLPRSNPLPPQEMEKADFCPHCNFLPHSFSPPQHHPLSPPPPRTERPVSVCVLMDSPSCSTRVFGRGGGRKDEQRCLGVRAGCQSHAAICLVLGGGGSRAASEAINQTLRGRGQIFS